MKKTVELDDIRQAVVKYAEARIKETNIEECRYCKDWEYKLLESLGKLSSGNAVIFALVIGFANGVEWAKNNN